MTSSELAVPFSKHQCRHLQAVDRQGTSSRSRFLDACRSHNAGEITQDDLVETTRRLGFQNVIDAFHVLDGADIRSGSSCTNARTREGSALPSSWVSSSGTWTTPR